MNTRSNELFKWMRLSSGVLPNLDMSLTNTKAV
jgi:hypothetical protein